MRVTLNDGRQMTGQMLAFDKVKPLKLYRIVSGQSTDYLSAYEPRLSRYRRISQSEEKSSQISTCRTRLSCSTSNGRIRRKAYTGSYNSPWHKHSFVFRGRPTTVRPVCQIGPERAWRSTSYLASGTWNQQTSRKRAASGIGRTSGRYWRPGTTYWVWRFSA